MDHGIIKIILFELGQTLEDHDVYFQVQLICCQRLRVCAIPIRTTCYRTYLELLRCKQARRSRAFRKQYYSLLEHLKIRSFFEVLTERVTLSIEVGVEKPDEKIFRTAIDKIQKDLPYKNVIFITDEKDHIVAARKYGMMAIR